MDASPLAFLAHLGRSPYIGARRVGGCEQLIARDGMTPFNSVFRVAWPENETEARVREVRAMYAAEGLAALWWIGPSAVPEDLAARLETLGLRRLPSSWLMRTLLTARPPSSASVALVRTERDLADWSTVYAATHPVTSEQVDFNHRVYASLLDAEDEPLTHVVMRESGVPLAAASVFLHEDLAGVYNVATVPGARGRGLAAAVTSAALAYAWQRGYRRVMLGAEEAAVGIYHRMGFQMCGELVCLLCPAGSV